MSDSTKKGSSSDQPPSSSGGVRSSLHEGGTELLPEADSSMEFAGWGTVERIVIEGGGEPTKGHVGHKLGEFASTAICGNDITS
ncbi:MAG: hypothetical protein KC731_42150, partial [Myxococcales bacterium]|nr:hypothetical protein [Myxococcales bacterium]